MPVSYTPRLGLPVASDAGDPHPGRVGTNSIHQNLEARVTSYTVGPISTAGTPVAGAFRWDGQVLWWADPTMADPDDGTVQGWAPVSSDAYIDVRQYGALPLVTTRIPSFGSGPFISLDPYISYRQQDAGPGIQAAIDAALADPGADQFPGRWRRRKPIFIPPGTYAMFTPVGVTGDPTTTYKSDISIIGAFPATRLMVFDDVMGTNGTGAPLNYPGFPNNKCVFNVVGLFDVVTVAGLVFDGYTPGTVILSAVAADANVGVEYSDITVNQNLVCLSGCVDSTHDASIPDTFPVPSRIRNITGYSPIITFASRTGVATQAASYAVVHCGAGSGAVLENIHAIGTSHAVSLYEYGNRNVNGPDVTISGLTCNNVAVSDVALIEVRNVTIDGYRSIGGARCFAMIGTNSVTRIRVSGVFDCANLGLPSESAAERGDIALFANGILAGSLVQFENFYTPNAGSLSVTVRCSGLSAANRIHLENSEWANLNPAQIARVVSGGTPVLTYSGLRTLDAFNSGTPGCRDRLYPEPGILAVGAPTATSAAAIAISDASTASDLAKVLGEVVRALKAKGIMP